MSSSADLAVLVDGVTGQVDGETSLAYLTTCGSRPGGMGVKGVWGGPSNRR